MVQGRKAASAAAKMILMVASRLMPLSLNMAQIGTHFGFYVRPDCGVVGAALPKSWGQAKGQTFLAFEKQGEQWQTESHQVEAAIALGV